MADLMLHATSDIEPQYAKDCLIKHCGHQVIQAAQCVLIAANNINGAHIKTGSIHDVITIRIVLDECGLKTTLILGPNDKLTPKGSVHK